MSVTAVPSLVHETKTHLERYIEMKTSKSKLSHAVRLDMGELVLLAADRADVSLVEKEVAGLAEAHQRFVAAQSNVDAAQGRVRAEVGKLSGHIDRQDDLLEPLLVALVADGHPRLDPLAAFGGGKPSSFQRLGYKSRQKAFRKLVTAILGNGSPSEATVAAAMALERSVDELERCLEPVEPLEAELRTARRKRNLESDAWDTAYAALRSAARHASFAGAKELYGELFDRAMARPPTRKRKPAAEAAGEAAGEAVGEGGAAAEAASVPPVKEGGEQVA